MSQLSLPRNLDSLPACDLAAVTNSNQGTALKVADGKSVTLTCNAGYALSNAATDKNPEMTATLTCNGGTLGTVPTCVQSTYSVRRFNLPHLYRLIW